MIGVAIDENASCHTPCVGRAAVVVEINIRVSIGGAGTRLVEQSSVGSCRNSFVPSPMESLQSEVAERKSSEETA